RGLGVLWHAFAGGDARGLWIWWGLGVLWHAFAAELSAARLRFLTWSLRGTWAILVGLTEHPHFVMPPSPIARSRRICLALPEAHEVVAWAEPTFRVGNKMFAVHASPNNHHGAGRPAVWCQATPSNQQLMIDADPER